MEIQKIQMSNFTQLGQAQRSLSEDCGPKEGVARISFKVGGILQVCCPGELPRNERQATYLQCINKKQYCTDQVASSEELYAVMFCAKDMHARFIREIKILPEVGIVLGN